MEFNEDDFGITDFRLVAQQSDLNDIKACLVNIIETVKMDAQAKNAIKSAGLVKSVWSSLPSVPERNRLILKYHKLLLDVYNTLKANP